MFADYVLLYIRESYDSHLQHESVPLRERI